MFSSVVRTTLGACGGYECQEKDGIFMLAFGDPGEGRSDGVWCVCGGEGRSDGVRGGWVFVLAFGDRGEGRSDGGSCVCVCVGGWVV